MSIQDKLQDAKITIRSLELLRDKQRHELVALRLKLSVIEKLAVNTSDDPNNLLRKIAALFEAEQ